MERRVESKRKIVASGEEKKRRTSGEKNKRNVSKGRRQMTARG